MFQSYQDLLNHKEIRSFTDGHQGCIELITDAAKRLYDKNDALASLQKLCEPLRKGEVNIFLSYKAKDDEIAQAFADMLSKNSADKLKITYQAQFIERFGGRDYRVEINKALNAANWFILLITDPSDDWDWCLYETGFFEGKKTSADNLFCIHNASSPPSPIAHYNHVHTRRDKLERFLRKTFIEPHAIDGLPPINPRIRDDIGSMALELERIFRRRTQTQRRIYEPWVELHIDNAKELQCKDDLDSAKIISANRSALDVFTYDDKPDSFGELREGIKEVDNGRWRNELFHVVRRAAKKKQFYPIQAIFQTHDNKFYRPVLCAVDKTDDGDIKTYHVTFTEEVTHGDTSSVPDELYVVGMIMRSAYRFRWEVLEPFTKKTLEIGDVERLDNSLRRINAEAQSRGLAGDEMMDRLVNIFPEEHQKTIKEMFRAWYAARNPVGTGTLDKAIENKEIEKIPVILREFIPINQKFLELASDLLCDLISDQRTNGVK